MHDHPLASGGIGTELIFIDGSETHLQLVAALYRSVIWIWSVNSLN
jgi:hypothetical protein